MGDGSTAIQGRYLCGLIFDGNSEIEHLCHLVRLESCIPSTKAVLKTSSNKAMEKDCNLFGNSAAPGFAVRLRAPSAHATRRRQA